MLGMGSMFPIPESELTSVGRLIVIPLSFLRRLDSLKYTSVIALVSIGYLVILVLYHFFKGDTLEERGDVRVFKWAGPVETLAAFPVIVFAYTCHQNVRRALQFIWVGSSVLTRLRCSPFSTKSTTNLTSAPLQSSSSALASLVCSTSLSQ